MDEDIAPIVLATSEQVAEIKRIVDLLKIDAEALDKWLTKAQAGEIEELSKENAAKFLDFLNKKLKGDEK